MKKTLIVYTSKNKSFWEGVYGKEGNLFLNISRGNIDDIQGMRFEKIIFEEEINQADISEFSRFKIKEKGEQI